MERGSERALRGLIALLEARELHVAEVEAAVARVAGELAQVNASTPASQLNAIAGLHACACALLARRKDELGRTLATVQGLKARLQPLTRPSEAAGSLDLHV